MTLAFPTASAADVVARYGIPDDAGRVLVFSESSHWDPNWLFTSREYYRLRVRRVLKQALRAVERDPRRVWTCEHVFFLRMFWDDQPRLRDRVQAAFARGAWRLSGDALGTPDTISPHTEALVREWARGRAWLRSVGIEAETGLAYLPDNFGNSPALPSLLRSLGVEATAFARLDGAFFVGTDTRPESAFPRPGSNAWRLMRQERSLDFVWRDEAGAEVLARFCAFAYNQGDMLGYRPLAPNVGRWMSIPLLTVPDRRAARVREQIDGFAERLAPLSRTRFLHCPIGHDFVLPMPHLMRVIDGYNARDYPETGTWCVLATLEDYLTLVNAERDRLPVLDFAPAPHATGVYTSRPMLRRRYRAAVDALTLAEAEAAADRLAGRAGADLGLDLGALGRHWDWVALANHHDWVTGTAPERVYQKEQKPAIDAALAAANAARPTARPRAAAADAVFEARADGWHARAGGAALRVRQRDGRLALDAPPGVPDLLDGSGDLLLFEDSGGGWRMGHELDGGALAPLGRASDHACQTETADGGRALVTRYHTPSGEITRTLRLSAERLLVTVEGLLAPRHTADLLFHLPPLADRVTFGAPGGTHTHGHRHLHDPSYVSADQYAALPGDGGTAALLFSGQAALTTDAGGAVRVIALRHARRERAGGDWLLGFPSEVEETRSTRFDCALALDAAALADEGGRNLAARWVPRPEVPGYRPLGEVVAEAVAVAPAWAHVLAFVPGPDGVLLRLLTEAPAEVAVRPRRPGWAVRRCRADGAPLAEPARPGGWRGRLPGGVHTFRLARA